MSDDRRVGARIKERRMLLGIKRAALARAVGYSDAEPLRKVEVGDVVPQGDRLAKIAAALGTTVEQLTGAANPGRNATPPPPKSADEWVQQLPPGAPETAVEMAKLAWRIASEVALPRPTQTPTLTPATRSASQELVAPHEESGMRAKSAKPASVRPEKRGRKH